MDQAYNTKLVNMLEPGNDDHVMFSHVVSFYHESLKRNKKALAYIKKRCISGDAVDHFNIGYSDRTLGLAIPKKNTKAGALKRGQLHRIEILLPTGHEAMRGRITVPIRVNGVNKSLYGRMVGNKVRTGVPLHLFVPDAQKGIFNLEAIEISEELILCQSIFDALTFWSAGFRNVTCTYGLDGFTDELREAITCHSVQRVLIAFENTDKANSVATTVSEQLMPLGVDCYRIEFPKGKDANATANTVEMPSASGILGEAIRKAVWMGKGSKVEPPSDNGNSGNIADINELEQETVYFDLQDSENGSASEIKESDEDEVVDDTESEIVADSPPLPATVLPPSLLDVKTEVNDDDIVIHLENRRYRIRGLEKNLCVDQLKVNILVNTEDGLFVDTFDLYAAKPRASFIKQAALELDVTEEVIKQDLGKVLLKLEQLQDDFIREALTTKPQPPNPMTEKERIEALSLLQSPHLLQCIVDDYERCGVVGERTNKLMGYLSALSRKLDNPLAVMIQSTSAAGKSALMDAVLSFVPEEDRIQYSAMTGQSLFYMGSLDVKHKILAISEEEGASNASYALKLLQSDGQLTIASTGKDTKTGKLTTQEYKVEGPVMIFSTTTAIDIDEELLNRCIVLTVDEDRTQTQAIHDWQRFQETLEGLMASQEREAIVRVHRNAQRLIEPLKVINPFAKQLTFLSDKTRTRRDHKKYLTLIRTIALLHQYQREIKTTYYQGEPIQYIEATLDDIAMANQLAHEVLGRSLDEMPHQTRRLLILIDTMVREACHALGLSRSEYRFGRRDIRACTGWGETQLKVHLQRLEALEYLLIHSGGRGKPIVYELLYNSEGQDGKSFLMGLADVKQLVKSHHSDKLSASNPQSSVSGLPQVGALSVPGHHPRNAQNLTDNNQLPHPQDDQPDQALAAHSYQQASYTPSYTRPHTATQPEGK